MDAMKHHQNLSYFVKRISYFCAYVIYLESLHLNKHISIFWVSTLVTRYIAVSLASEAEEEGEIRSTLSECGVNQISQQQKIQWKKISKGL